MDCDFASDKMDSPGPSHETVGRMGRKRRLSALSDSESDQEAMANNGGDSSGAGVSDARSEFRASFKEICGRSSTKHRYYIAGVWLLQDLGTIKDLFSQLFKASSAIIWLWTFVEENHVHVLHDCPFSNRTCRCFVTRIARRKSSPIRLAELSQTARDAIEQYYFSEGQKDLVFRKVPLFSESHVETRVTLNRSYEGPPGGARVKRDVEMEEPFSDPLFGYQRKPAGQYREDGTSADFDFIEAGGEPSGGGSGGTKSKKLPHSVQQQTLKERRYRAQIKDYEEKMIAICCTPIDETINSNVWQNDEDLRYLPERNTALEVAVKNIRMTFRDMTLKERIDFYENTEFVYGHPLFAAKSIESFDKLYLKLSVSYNYLVVWIAFQLGLVQVDSKTNPLDIRLSVDDWHKIALFVKELTDWLQANLDRRYTYCLYGASQSGKTLFADCIADFICSYGVMHDMNRNNNFPMQMCVDKHLYYWNEPNYEDAKLEELKKILGGDKHTLTAKYKNDRTSEGNRVLITANHRPFPNQTIFNSRIIYKQVSTCNILAQVNGKRYHPFALIKLINVCEEILEQELVV